MEQIRRSLAWVGFLDPLSDEGIEELVRRATFVRLDAGGVLTVSPEEHRERMLLVATGQLQVYEVAPSGRELTLSILSGGSPVGATGLAGRRARSLHLRALESSVVCRIDREDLEALVLRDPRVGLALARLLAGRLVGMEERWADLADKAVPARLAGVLLMLLESEGVVTPEGPMIPTRYTHQQLASMIGANREAVTRAFAELQEGGAVEVRGRRVYIGDPDALRRRASG